MTSKSESVNVPLEKDNEHKTFPLSQKDGCKDVSSNGDGIQMNDNTEKAAPENLQSPQLVNSILHGGVLDCDINLEMVQEVMPSESKGHDIVIDSVASPIMSSKDICTSAAAEILSSSGCKRKDCCETCGTCSKRQRFLFLVDDNLTGFIVNFSKFIKLMTNCNLLAIFICQTLGFAIFCSLILS